MFTARVPPRPRPARTLHPETAEERAALASLGDEQLARLTDIAERAVRRAFLDGAEIGRREVEEENRQADQA